VMRIADILEHKGTQVLTVTPEISVARVVERLRTARVGAFVVSRDGVHLDGILTERDIVAGLSRHGDGLLALPASSIMSEPVVTCAAHDSVEHVLAEMTKLWVRHVPVIELGRLCGIISMGDVMKAFVDESAPDVEVLRDTSFAR
jgi:CBS domain-containing protein